MNGTTTRLWTSQCEARSSWISNSIWSQIGVLRKEPLFPQIASNDQAATIFLLNFVFSHQIQETNMFSFNIYLLCPLRFPWVQRGECNISCTSSPPLQSIVCRTPSGHYDQGGKVGIRQYNCQSSRTCWATLCHTHLTLLSRLEGRQIIFPHLFFLFVIILVLDSWSSRRWKRSKEEDQGDENGQFGHH